jgi:N-methylhydantoinase B
VRNEFLSPQKAEADYGVVIDTKTWRVDETATKKQRDAIRTKRGWREVPKVQWHDPIAPQRAAE